jgi:hypothetical protein
LDEEYVLRLDIPMNDTVAVGEIQGVADLKEYFNDDGYFDLTFSVQPLAERLSLEKLQYQIVPELGMSPEIEDRHDIWMLKRGGNLHLQLKALPIVIIPNEVVGQDLDGDIFRDTEMLCQVYFPRSAIIDELFNLIPVIDDQISRGIEESDSVNWAKAMNRGEEISANRAF